jgi:eukaryotic-like serine/threonine-protein kinase
VTADLAARLATALVDRYRIERELGAGGMATVYLAQDLKHERKVALKVLKPELAAVLGAERFVVEIKTTASLQHPHILPLFDSGTADGFLYYVMPYIEGETLRDKLSRETQLGVEQAVRITSEVADALDYAHRRGIIHRDIKPENILLHDGRPMVADFGIALAVSAAAGGRMTETGLSLGTPHYMSPEQATAEKEITARSDVYSLASVLYEMLAGQPPHLGGTAQMVIMKIIAEPVELVTKFRKAVPPHVAAALAKALEKLPADRFESAKAFQEALANPAFTTGTALSAAGPWRTTGVPRGAFFGLAAVAVLAIGAALWGWFRPTPRPEVTRYAVALPAGASIGLDRNSLRLAVSRDGRKIVYTASAGNVTQLYLRHLDQLTPQPIPGTLGAINPSFSPDGNRIAFVAPGSPRLLKVVSLSGGPPQALTDSLVDLGGVSWGADGYIYYDAHFEGDGLARIRETGGRPEIASRPADATESWHASPAALPNGRGVLFTVARARGAQPYDIAVLDIRTGKHRVLLRGTSPQYAESGHLLFVSEDGALMAIRFDPERLTTSGDAVSLAEGLALRALGRAELAVSENGLLAYLTGNIGSSNRELVWVTRDGKFASVDSSWIQPITSRPVLSPDGKQVTMSLSNGSRFDVWVKRLDRGPASKLADAGASPNWTPDGRAIVYYAAGGIYQGPADGSIAPTLRYPRRDLFSNVEYSPDGEWLIGTYAGDVTGVRTTGDTATLVLAGGVRLQRRGTISPDGKWLAYESDEDGVNQVYVRPFPNTQAAKHQISVNGGGMARWSRDGHELFFVSEASELMAVPVTLGSGFSSGVPRALFKAGVIAQPVLPFDVYPDGRRFLFARQVGSTAEVPDQLVVVENFLSELKARLP